MSVMVNQSQLAGYGLEFAIDDATTIFCIRILYTAMCQMINMFGITTNIINIICFVKQGFKDVINISLLGMQLKPIQIDFYFMKTCQSVVT